MELIGKALTHSAVGAVGTDQEIATFALGRNVADVGLKVQLDAKLGGSLLQDRKKPLARDSAKAVAPRSNRMPIEMNLDIVPMGERLGDLAPRRLVGRPQILQRRVGEDDAPSKGIERPIPFDDSNRP
jgi:hypothetical protein